MNKQHSPFSLPRKELLSALQRSLFIIFLLLFFGAFALYKLMDLNLEERSHHENELAVLESKLDESEMSWLQWLLVNEREDKTSKAMVSGEEWHNNLINEYSEIERILQNLNSQLPNSASSSVKDMLVFVQSLEEQVEQNKPLTRQQRLHIYEIIEETNKIDIKLNELEESHSYKRMVSEDDLVWAPFVVLGFIAFVLVLVGMHLAKRLSRGLAHLHYVIEKHKHGGITIEQSYHKVDEFTDLGRLFDNELSSREFDRQKAQVGLQVLQKSVSHLRTPFLIANVSGDVEWLSEGFSELWQSNEAVFESYFCIDKGIGGPLGEQLPDTILQAQDDHRLLLGEGAYRVKVQKIEDDTDLEKPTFFYLMVLVPVSDVAELEVLRKSLELMRQGGWNIPIRLLREDSPFFPFAHDLEAIRQSVSRLLSFADDMQVSVNHKVKITKLQQIETLLEEKINDNHFTEKEIVAVPSEPPHHMIDELDSMSFLSEQIHDSVLIGYELLLQRLAMVEKDIANGVIVLSEVDRCLNEVRAGVLSSLSATEGENDLVRHRFSLDLNHDIDGVQKHIESIKIMSDSTLTLLQSDRSVGMARLERAKQSVEELSERISALLEKESSPEAKLDSQIELTFVDDKNDQKNEL